ncbi:uncharacterized protein LOC124915112 [Impatiens glandulifera]|uniref:uncharacterized protein LOC124915112 n=1 Tax=Impatiens glandulifera TaxID=253017 RepID=UPI001FB093BA|nr:uncharacterized protein LOC124915112 [Impatiens glandulifera]
MNQSDPCFLTSLPDDIAHKIVFLLQAPDVSSLGSCSRTFRDLCGLDSVWLGLCRDRWPSQEIVQDSLKGWKGSYINKHMEMTEKAKIVVKFVDQCFSNESIEVGYYLAAIENLRMFRFGFKDVEILFFKPDMNVILNLVGLHYCIGWLGVPVEDVIEALRCTKIPDREVCVRWWKLGRWFYGFRMHDESRFRQISLKDLIKGGEDEVMRVLHRGALHEVMRVQISVTKLIPVSSWATY